MRAVIAFLLFLSQYTPAGPVFPTTSNPCSLPYSDNFAGSSGAALNSCWTTSTASGIQAPQVNGSNAVQGPVSFAFAMAVMNGATTPANQSAQVHVLNLFANLWGPVVRGSVSGNGYIWVPFYGNVAVITAGSVGGSIGGCPTVSIGDTIKLSVSGSMITCLNVTTGISSSAIDTTYATGYAGVYVINSPSMGSFVVTSP
jgi:hypothetical protein